MSTAASVTGEKGRLPIVISDRVHIPAWVVDHESYRRWARSEEYPENGWFSFLNGHLWVDFSMERIFSHNQVKGEFAVVLGGLVKVEKLGRFFHDRLLLSNPAAALTTEPDGLFVSWETLRSEQVRLVEGAGKDYVELEGTPDMILEVVSPSSVRKDNLVLRDLYCRANIAEYWLVDARGSSPRFNILRHKAKGYVPTPRQAGGWLKSAVFGKRFRLTQQTDPLGHPQYTLEVQGL